MAVDIAQAVYAREFITPTFVREITPLLSAHWNELHGNHDLVMAPDWVFYITAEAQGMLRVYTARKDGVLVGYSVFFVRRAPTAKDSMQANENLVYLDPALRGRGVGEALSLFSCAQLEAEGVDVAYLTVPRGSKRGESLERNGFALHELVYSKRLGKEAL